MNLDIGTIIFLTCLITFTMGAILFVVARSNPSQIKGVREWAWSCVLQGIAWVLLAERGQIPDFLSIVMGNTILVAVVTMQFQAILRFKERKSFGLWLFIPTALSFAALNYFSFISPDISIRTTIVGLFCMSFCLLSGSFFIFKQRHPIIFTEWILTVVFVVIGLILLFRTLYIWFFDPTLVHLYTDNQMQGVIFSTICIADVLLTFSFAMMLNERFREEILRLAKIDPLTEIYNRAAMEQMYKNELRRADRYNSPVSLLMLDLDFFKVINDTYGHQVGDKTLKILVKSITEQLRSTDILSRYGGEEFAILLPDSNSRGAEIAAERLCRKVEKSLITVDGYKFSITVSIGVADFKFEGDSLEKLINRADKALFQAKQSGRNRVVVFEENETLMRKIDTGKLEVVS